MNECKPLPRGRVTRRVVVAPSSSFTSPAPAASSENGLACAEATRTAAAAAEDVAGAADTDTAEVARCRASSIKTRVESAPGRLQRLKRKCSVKAIPNFAFNFNSRRCTEADANAVPALAVFDLDACLLWTQVGGAD